MTIKTSTVAPDETNSCRNDARRRNYPIDLLLFSDGTGNHGGVTQNTNVWRLYNMLDIHNARHKVRTFYDDGIGTNSNILSKVMGLAFGYGLSRNVCDLYTFLVKNYLPGDRIFLFGFSRGAYTIRVLADLVCTMGIWCDDQYFSCEKGEAKKSINMILQEYRAIEKDPQWRFNGLRFQIDVPIKFVGVWDTVDAVGMPIDELKWLFRIREYSWVPRRWRLRQWGFSDHNLNPQVEHARQALSIDDDRWTFHPNVWNEDPDRIEQVWFAGAHSNIGGGYPKDGLSLLSLDWMLSEMERVLGDAMPPVLLRKREEAAQRANAFDRHYEARRGFGRLYRYRPRRLEDLSRHRESQYTHFLNSLFPKVENQSAHPLTTIKIHRSVWRRIELATQNYAPLFLPPTESELEVIEVDVANSKTKAVRHHEWTHPRLNLQQQAHLDKWVKLRQLSYLVYAIPAILMLALLILLYFSPSLRAAYCGNSELIASASPAFLLEIIRCNPGVSYPILALIAVAGIVSRVMGKLISAKSFAFWQSSISKGKY